MSPTTVTRIIRETTSVIWEVLCEQGFMQHPETETEWKHISKEFFELWNFPNCLGCIDGKHVVIQAPGKSGSAYYNYKKSFSIVLLAVCDAKYQFTLVDIGEPGRKSDSGIYATSELGRAIESNTLNYPKGEVKIDGYHDNIKFPYVFLSDEGFALKKHMMRPYPSHANTQYNKSEVIFNYRLSRARRVIENTFGILATRFRIFRRPIIANVDNIRFITRAAVALHNFLMKEDHAVYYPDTNEIIANKDITGLVHSYTRIK